MSLQVWLPLDGDLRNNGLSDVTITNNGATVDNNGKIGKCYYFNGSSHIHISLPPELTSIKNSSVCAWVKSTGSTVALGGISSNSTYAYPMMTLYTSGWQFAGTSAYKYISGGSIANSGIWHHICCTAADDIVTTYLDGVVVASKTYSEIGTDKWILNSSINFIEIGCDHPGGDEYLTGYVNDFRVYNHCLSLKEVKLLSQGLVCHYKLSEPFSIDNLIRNTTYSVYNNYVASGSTASLVATGAKFEGCDIYRLTYTPNDTSIQNVKTALFSHGIVGFRRTFTANTKYCFWILWRPISHSDTVVGGTASNIGGWTEIPTKKFVNDWNIVGQYRNGTVTTDKTDYIFTSFKTPSAVSGEPIIIDFCCPHLVEGYDYILPENEYQLNDENVVYDSSGYNNHMTAVGTPIASTNSIRNTYSTHFTNTQYVIANENSNTGWLPIEALTVNLWMYCTTWNNPISCTEGGGWNFENSSGVRFPVYIQGVGYKTANSGIQPSALLNDWHMLTGVFTGTEVKIYIDNELKGNTTTGSTNGIKYAANRLCIAAEAQAQSPASTAYVGNISDVRIYATALSEEDIQQLYNDPVSITNTGAMLTQGEFVEVTT